MIKTTLHDPDPVMVVNDVTVSCSSVSGSSSGNGVSGSSRIPLIEICFLRLSVPSSFLIFSPPALRSVC